MSLVVLKYGGAAMTDPALADAWAEDVVGLLGRGLRPVVVHGGGPALTRMLARLGIESEFVDGHRVTSAEAAEVAQMVLSGSANKEIVARLERAGGRAVGLSGTDGAVLDLRRRRNGGKDLGFVGEVVSVDPSLLLLLVDKGYIPVLSSTGVDAAGERLNVNADLVAGAVAAALGAASLLFLTDVDGVLVGNERVPLLDAAGARALLAEGSARGGMRPKLEAALAALEAGVPRVRIVDGRQPHVASDGLRNDADLGTLLVRDGPPRPSWAGTLGARGATSLMPTYARYPIELASGAGCSLVDSSGTTYLDFVAGIAVTALGHAHPAVVAAIRGASSGLLHVSNLYWTEPMVRLAETLTRVAGMERAFFCNSGAEAIEAAIKLARKARPGRSRIVVFERSFHGRTLGALSATAQPHYREGFEPLLPGIHTIPYGDFDAASQAIDGSVAAVLVEPIQGEGGVRPAPRSWLRHLRAACDAAGALLILDEVQTGIGRTGTFLAYQGEEILPDAVAVAKALAGGLPMGALLARGDAAQALGPGQHGSTFGGGPLVASVAHAVLDVVLGEGFLDEVKDKGEHLGRHLARIVATSPLVSETRGRGLMWGLVLREPDARELVEILMRRRMLAVPAGDDVLRLLPPLTITRAEIDLGVGTLEEALAELRARRPAAVGA